MKFASFLISLFMFLATSACSSNTGPVCTGIGGADVRCTVINEGTERSYDPGACTSYGTDAAISSDTPGNGVRLVSASYAVDTSPRIPLMKIAGQFVGEPSDGSYIWIVGNPDRSTYDSVGEPGSGLFYPKKVSMFGDGCWTAVESIGYEDALGLTVNQILVSVDGRANAAFESGLTEMDADVFYGYDPTPIASFSVDT